MIIENWNIQPKFMCLSVCYFHEPLETDIYCEVIYNDWIGPIF